jgi:hypothetical protein
VHSLTTTVLVSIYYVFKLGGRVAIVVMTGTSRLHTNIIVLFEFVNYGLSIASYMLPTDLLTSADSST